MQTIRVNTPTAKYEVVAGSGLLQTLAPRIERAIGKLPRRVFVLTSPAIWALWRETFCASFREQPVALFLPPGEKHKTMASVDRLLREMMRAGADRGSLVIAFGGGIVGDVGGFVAAIFMRGIPYVQVPTTFLSQVDSSVGGKTGVNLPEGKNLVGSFHQPRAVFADIGVLGTLPDRELRAGLMESVKAGIIRDRALVRYMEENAPLILGRDAKALEKVIAASIRMKAGVVNIDERESGLRMILNLGHTVGHAIEQATAYKVLLHGEAVAWGMIAALHLGAAGDDFAVAVRAAAEPGVPVRTAACAQAARGQSGSRHQRGQEECGRCEALCAAAGHRRCRCGGRRDGGGVEGAVGYMLAQAKG